ncbi:MAG: sortase [Streptosporangiaceae bacterium]|nr:sortase [Streptosporangiaceae bacterium]
MTLVNPSPPSAPDAGAGRGGGARGQARPPGVSASVRRHPASNPPGLVREAAGTALWILAIYLIGFGVWFAFFSRLYYDRAQHDTYANFRNSLALAIAPTGPTQLDFTQPAKPPHLLAPGTAVAVLDIPEIGLKAVVFEGTSGQVLESGPGHVRDTPLPGQVGTSVIFGRRTGYGGPFSRVPALHVGDTFTVTTGQGVASYRVIDVRHPGDLSPSPPAAGHGRLILTTADGPPLIPSGVLRVDADLTSKADPTPAMVLSTASLGASEQALGTDSLAWLPLVLWGQGLLIMSGVLSWCRQRWGRWQTWIVAVPVLGFLGLSIADQAARLLPNLM